MLELKIPVKHYTKISHLGVEEAFKRLDQETALLSSDYMLFKLESRILNFYGNMNNAKRSSDEEFCIFARYEDLVPHGHETELKAVFAPLVEKTKTYFAQSLEEFENNKVWKKSA